MSGVAGVPWEVAQQQQADLSRAGRQPKPRKKPSDHMQGPLWSHGGAHTPARPLDICTPQGYLQKKEGWPGHQQTGSTTSGDWSETLLCLFSSPDDGDGDTAKSEEYWKAPQAGTHHPKPLTTWISWQPCDMVQILSPFHR